MTHTSFLQTDGCFSMSDTMTSLTNGQETRSPNHLLDHIPVRPRTGSLEMLRSEVREGKRTSPGPLSAKPWMRNTRPNRRAPDEEFTASSLREKIEEMTKGSISQGSLNNYLQRLVSDDFSAILHRCSKGVYRFSDPRMPSFICMANPDDFAGESPTIGSLGCQPTSRKR